jgi:hypothetical protein
MRRLLIAGLSIAGLSFSLVMTGCGGGGMEEGMPADTTPAVPLDSVKTQMVTPNKIPKTTPPPEAKTETPK